MNWEVFFKAFVLCTGLAGYVWVAVAAFVWLLDDKNRPGLAVLWIVVYLAVTIAAFAGLAA